MQLPSLVLSATALLAGAASGFLLFSDHPELVDLEAARIGPTRSGTPVGFWPRNLPAAQIRLFGNGTLHPPFVLRFSNQGEWLFSADGGPANANDITGPFIVDEDDYFLYKGEGGGVWNACQSKDGYDIYLSTVSMQRVECMDEVTLRRP